MSEITKLYENAGVKKINTHQSEIDNGDPRFTGISHSDSYIKYPPFTAEKQLNLIIFLANREIRISPTYISSGYYLNDLHKIKSSRNISNFENSLAQHINAIWQDLTEEEKATSERNFGMSKYIIKNCPACRQYQVGIYTCDDLYDCDLQRCQDCTDCLLKQIVELCKESLNSLENYVDVRSFECVVLQNILKLLDIQEVE